MAGTAADPNVRFRPQHPRKCAPSPRLALQPLAGHRLMRLGLAIGEAIARAHGGELLLEDKEPGLRAVIALPALP